MGEEKEDEKFSDESAQNLIKKKKIT